MMRACQDVLVQSLIKQQMYARIGIKKYVCQHFKFNYPRFMVIYQRHFHACFDLYTGISVTYSMSLSSYEPSYLEINHPIKMRSTYQTFSFVNISAALEINLLLMISMHRCTEKTNWIYQSKSLTDRLTFHHTWTWWL